MFQDKNANFWKEEKFRKKVCVWGFTVIQKFKMLQTVEYCTIYITVHTADIVPSFSIKITSFNVLEVLAGLRKDYLALIVFRIVILNQLKCLDYLINIFQ